MSSQPRRGMYTSSPLRGPEWEKNLLPVDPLECDKSPEEWRPQEEFTVSDVFTPQTMDGVGDEDYFGSRPTNNSDISSGGFRMSPTNVSPTKQSPALPDPKAKKGKKKNKKKNLHNIQTGGFTSPLANGVCECSSKDGSKATSPQLLPAGFKNKSESRPPSSNGGVSALKVQLDALNISHGRPAVSQASKLGFETPDGGSATSESDQTEILTTYEVPLENDFVSTDIDAEGKDSVMNNDKMKDTHHRKMSAVDFDCLTCLGKGTYGTVLLVKQRMTGALYAQKQFRKASLTVQKRLVEQTKTERTILESVNRHPFVVKLFYAFQDHEKLYLILEYAQGGELFTHLAMERMFSEDVTAFYMAEMVLALEHLHLNVGVIYRDLKPENCLLDVEGHLLLTDFGLSKVAVSEDDRCNSSLGTVEYMAPEVIQGKSYGKACDWWSLGALGFDLLTGSPPFKGNNHAKITERILKQKLALPYFLGPDAKDLLTRLLRKDPSKRLGYHLPKDIKTIKGHRFFKKIDWKALEMRQVDPPINPVITDPELAENFSNDFTNLPLSPVVTSKPNPFGMANGTDIKQENSDNAAYHDDPFGGFSFVAPSSLLDNGIASSRWDDEL